MSNTLTDALLELDDYIRGHHTDADAFEEAMFARALSGEATELGFRSGLGGTLAAMKARGTLKLWLTSAELADVQNLGLKVTVFELDLSNPMGPVIPDDADLLITRVPLELAGVHRLESELVGASGRTLKRMPDIRFDAKDNAIFALCEAELARTATSANQTTRFWAIDEHGHKRLLLELPGM